MDWLAEDRFRVAEQHIQADVTIAVHVVAAEYLRPDCSSSLRRVDDLFASQTVTSTHASPRITCRAGSEDQGSYHIWVRRRYYHASSDCAMQPLEARAAQEGRQAATIRRFGNWTFPET